VCSIAPNMHGMMAPPAAHAALNVVHDQTQQYLHAAELRYVYIIGRYCILYYSINYKY